MNSELSVDEALAFLAVGELEILGLLPYASNATLLARCAREDEEVLAIYKPRAGERPLWDFPDGTLYRREVAAFVVDHALGWRIVPPTVLRDGPAGVGSVQLFIDEDETADIRDVGRTHPEILMRIALFDAIVNNADRKAGHMLIDKQAAVWGIDHGICFHEEDKLRTVIWLPGKPIGAQLLEGLRGLQHQISHTNLPDLLLPAEFEALSLRIARLLSTGVYPDPPPGGHAVPWPPW